MQNANQYPFSDSIMAVRKFVFLAAVFLTSANAFASTIVFSKVNDGRSANRTNPTQASILNIAHELNSVSIEVQNTEVHFMGDLQITRCRQDHDVFSWVAIDPRSEQDFQFWNSKDTSRTAKAKSKDIEVIVMAYDLGTVVQKMFLPKEAIGSFDFKFDVLRFVSELNKKRIANGMVGEVRFGFLVRSTQEMQIQGQEWMPMGRSIRASYVLDLKLKKNLAGDVEIVP